jgi:hypothetical protein
MILPPPVTRKRFVADLLDFILGMQGSSFAGSGLGIPGEDRPTP